MFLTVAQTDSNYVYTYNLEYCEKKRKIYNIYLLRETNFQSHILGLP